MRNNFKNLSFAELKVKREELSRKYHDLRFQMVIGHVDNPLQKRVLRRQIARLNSMIRAQEIEQARTEGPKADIRSAATQSGAKE